MMKRIKIRSIKHPDPAINWDFEAESVEPRLSQLIGSEACGKPERWVHHKDEPMAEGYNEADVLEERTVVDSPAVDAVMDDSGAIVQEAIPARTHREVKLRAEYTVEVVDITQAVALEKLSTEALRYLESTDWYVIRELDAGVPCPVEIKQARAEARGKVIR